MIDVSIIIPVYNAEKYLAQCLDSVVRQTIKNKEVICVDDGSTDDSPAILKRYAERYPWIHTYRQENQGAGPARNLALSKASGRFVIFLDSDDWYMDEQGLELMVRAADEHDCKACACLRQMYDNETGRMKPQSLFRNLGLKKGEGRVLKFSEYQQDYHYQNYILSREMLLGNGVSFPSLRRYQDPPFLARALLAAGRVFVTGIEMYCFRNQKHEYMNGQYILDTLRGMRICMQIARDNEFRLLQRNTIYRIDNDFGRFLLANMNEQALKLLFEIDSLRIISDEIKLLHEIGETKFEEPFLLNKYIWLQQADISFADALARKGVRRVAVYGLGNQSEMFYHAVKGTNVEIVAALDKSRRESWHGLTVQSPEASLPVCDAIIVTPMNYEIILRELGEKRSERLISFRMLIEEMHDECIRAGERRAHIPAQAPQAARQRLVQPFAVTAILSIEGGSAYWSRALTSLCGQSLRNIEILVLLGKVDAVIREALQSRAAADRRLRIFDMAKLGRCERLRVAVEQARGDYCAFCPEDGYFERDMLQALYQAASQRNWPEMVKADYDRFLPGESSDISELSIRYGVMPRDRRKLYGQCVSLAQVPELLQRDACLASGIYRTDFLLAESILQGESAEVQDTAILYRAHLRARQELYLERGSVHVVLEKRRRHGLEALQAVTVLLKAYSVQEGKLSFGQQNALLRQAVESLALRLGLEALQNESCYPERLQVLHLQLKDYLATLSEKDMEALLADQFVRSLMHSPDSFRVLSVAQAMYRRDEQDRFLQRVARADLIETGRKPGVVIFGTGERGISVAAMLCCHAYQGRIVFCDNDPAKVGQLWQGFSVYAPAEAVLRHWDSVFVLPTPGLADVMRRQLVEYGVDSRQIVQAPEVWPYELLYMDWDGMKTMQASDNVN